MASTLDEFCPEETREHIYAVREEMQKAMHLLRLRSLAHDRSKCEEPERSAFDAMNRDQPLKGITYGSPEYVAALDAYPGAIKHHYEHNDHHPEHYIDGIHEMSLLSLLEMLCDWKAATARMKDGDIRRSIDLNAERFDYGWTPLTDIFLNTADELGW